MNLGVAILAASGSATFRGLIVGWKSARPADVH